MMKAIKFTIKDKSLVWTNPMEAERKDITYLEGTGIYHELDSTWNSSESIEFSGGRDDLFKFMLHVARNYDIEIM